MKTRGFEALIGQSDSFLQAVHAAASIAGSDAKVVQIIGGPGSGKRLFAHGVHRASTAPGALLRVCARALPASIVEEIGVSDLAIVRREPAMQTVTLPADPILEAGSHDTVLGQQTLEDVENQAVRTTLRATGGNRSAAARILGVSRPTLLRKVRKYGIGEWTR